MNRLLLKKIHALAPGVAGGGGAIPTTRRSQAAAVGVQSFLHGSCALCGGQKKRDTKTPLTWQSALREIQSRLSRHQSATGTGASRQKERRVGRTLVSLRRAVDIREITGHGKKAASSRCPSGSCRSRCHSRDQTAG
nr:hypothetical protein [Pandoravirus massiliensis]